MPQMTGIEVIKKLRDFCYDLEIIFLTNYENYVFESRLIVINLLSFYILTFINKENEKKVNDIVKKYDGMKRYYERDNFFYADVWLKLPAMPEQLN